MKKVIAPVVAAGLFVCGTAFAGVSTVINEFVANHTGSDTHEYIEVYGPPGANLSNLTVVEIEGDAGQTGLIDDATFTVGTTDAAGFWCTAFLSNVIENGTLTLLLVEGYTGATGVDVDLNDDGVIDNPQWTSIWDAVAVTDGGTGDLTYGVTLDNTLAPAGFPPGGASRIPNGFDSDQVSDWCRNDFNGFGLPGFTGDLDPDEAVNTPCARNSKDAATPTQQSTFGRVKALYR